MINFEKAKNQIDFDNNFYDVLKQIIASGVKEHKVSTYLKDKDYMVTLTIKELTDSPKEQMGVTEINPLNKN